MSLGLRLARELLAVATLRAPVNANRRAERNRGRITAKRKCWLLWRGSEIDFPRGTLRGPLVFDPLASK